MHQTQQPWARVGGPTQGVPLGPPQNSSIGAIGMGMGAGGAGGERANSAGPRPGVHLGPPQGMSLGREMRV
jgi:hypothetical protein